MFRDTSRSRLVLGVLLALSLTLLVLDERDDANPVSGTARAVGAAVFEPISAAVTLASRPISDGYRALAAAPGAQRRIAELEARNAELTRELESVDADAARSRELADLLHLAGLGRYEVVAAHAVTRMTAQGFSDTATLDVGRRDGVTADMTVVNGDGLVGRVVRTTERTSTVLLVTDGASSVGARLEGSKEIGVISGGTHGIADTAPLRLELLDGTATVRKGERVVTLGSHGGAPYVPGVPIGTVRHVEDTPGALTRTARVAPAVDLSRLDVVGVVVAPPETDPRDSVLPPKPDPRAQAEQRHNGRPDRGRKTAPKHDGAEDPADPRHPDGAVARGKASTSAGQVAPARPAEPAPRAPGGGGGPPSSR
ncbi:hypothetical protein DEF24_20205, partial [Marinitenerispora sediminis]